MLFSLLKCFSHLDVIFYVVWVTIIILVYRCTNLKAKKDSGNLQLCRRKLWLQCMWRTIQWLHLLNCSPDYFVLISFFKPIRIHKQGVLNRTGSLEPEVGLDISTSMETLKKVVCWWCFWSPRTPYMIFFEKIQSPNIFLFLGGMYL